MSEWRERLNVFLAKTSELEPSITVNREGGDQLTVIEGATLGESLKKNGFEPEPRNLGAERPEPRDTGISSPVIPMPTPAATTTDPNKPAAEFRATPRPLERLLENLKAVHKQLEDDRAHGFILETFDLGVPAKLTVRGTHYQVLERAVRSALKRTPDHDGTNTRRVQA